MKLGIDIGGVIITKNDDRSSDTSFFSNNFLNTPPTPLMFETVTALVKKFGSENVWLVSKCGNKIQDKTLIWLRHQDFFLRTGVLPDNIRFCKERYQKASIAEQLALTHFIDDRQDVLNYLTTVPNKYLFTSWKTIAGVLLP